MSEMAEFIARENIRRFKAQILVAEEGTRKTTLSLLLDQEEHHLRDLLAGKQVSSFAGRIVTFTRFARAVDTK